MTKFTSKIIDVNCQCGQKLFKYNKQKRGRLIRLYFDDVKKDYLNLLKDKKFNIYDKLFCPYCSKKLGYVLMVKGRLCIKLNQGSLQYTKT